MKKLLLILLIFTLIGCSTLQGKGSVKMKELTQNEQNEQQDVIMTTEEILEFNQKNLNENQALYDLNIEKISSKEIKELISKYKLPSLSYEDSIKIKENLNLENIKDADVQKGIIIQKTNLKAFPTEIIFKNDNYPTFDMNQETELHVNTPFVILHESLDSKYVFVLTKIYAGWVLKEDIALARVEDLEYWNSSNFCIITEKFVEVDDIVLDMGVTLPYIGSKNGYATCLLPIKDENGYVKERVIHLKENKVNIGYLEFTSENVVNQALKYEDVSYSWGGKDTYGIDCSGFVSNVLKVFGFELPRNTDDQEVCFENVYHVENMTNHEKINILNELSLGILYQRGHVMLYIGNLTMVHANATTMDVYVQKINESTNNLYKIDLIVSLEKRQFK